MIVSSFFYPQIKLCKMYLRILYAMFTSSARKKLSYYYYFPFKTEQNADVFIMFS
ncbi:hypothetical protein BMWSH_4058 [Priestia megaterium WSH-002]|uniref:Uncharacterized protein n=1 Tax=Priestia megaterium (strain WSH-002) TaxID=1006007 RepID=A0A8D4BLI9_PRIMW|nr:hypothetical protein BMWSH_4058 [Priestia megaterium WSH-002]